MSEQSPTNLGLATIDAVAMDNIKDVGATLLDTIMVPLLADTVLENIPYFGVLFKLHKVNIAIRDRIFLTNVGRFLFQLKDVPVAERRAFVDKMNADPTHKQRVGENVLLLLDRADDVEKAEVYGKLFQAHVRGLITYDSYRRFAGVISKTYVPDLNKLLGVVHTEYIAEPELSRDEQFALYALGLCVMPIVRSAEELVSTSLTKLGGDLRSLLLQASV